MALVAELVPVVSQLLKRRRGSILLSPGGPLTSDREESLFGDHSRLLHLHLPFQNSQFQLIESHNSIQPNEFSVKKLKTQTFFLGIGRITGS